MRIIYNFDMSNSKNKSDGSAVIRMYRWRSVVACIACFTDLFLSVTAVLHSVVMYTKEETEFVAFHYYTNDSNCYNAIIACMIIPFAIEGIRKKRFAYPRWLSVLHLSGTICVTITMVFAVCVISWYDTHLAFGTLGNFFLHIICPSCLILAFFLQECGYQFTKKETLLAIIPFLAYAVLYLVNVVILKRWRDIYHLTSFLPWYVSLVLMLVFAALMGFLLLYFYNRFGRKREKKITDAWTEDLTAEQISDEIHGLGRMNGKATDPAMVSMNLDIQDIISDHFGLDLEELSEQYSKGAVEGIREKPVPEEKKS